VGESKQEENMNTYAEAMTWINERAESYKSKNAFYASEEYRQAKPQIDTLYAAAVRDATSAAHNALEEMGLQVGDRVYYDYVTPWSVIPYTGKITMRKGMPMVKLDAGQANERRSTRWHRGWKREGVR